METVITQVSVELMMTGLILEQILKVFGFFRVEPSQEASIWLGLCFSPTHFQITKGTFLTSSWYAPLDEALPSWGAMYR